MQQHSDNYEPVHAFSRKPQCNQILSYCIVTTLLVVYLAAVQGNFAEQNNRICITVLFIVAFCVLIVSAVVTSKIDPTDPVLVRYRGGDRKLQGVQIQKCYYCDACRSVVQNSSRHCKKCDRCVDNFDHHCIWINNCVGDSNYHVFFVMIVAAMSLNVLYCIGVALLWQEQRWREYLAAMVIAWIVMAVSIVVGLLLTALVGFHIFLIINKTTSFDFIMKMREKDRIKELQAQQIANNNMNITEQAVSHNNPKTKAGANQNIFQNDSEQHSEVAAAQINSNPKEGYDAALPSPKKNSEQLKQFFDKHKSLKLLMGNGLAVKPFTQSDNKNYRSNIYVQQLKNKSRLTHPNTTQEYRSTLPLYLQPINKK